MKYLKVLFTTLGNTLPKIWYDIDCFFTATQDFLKFEIFELPVPQDLQSQAEKYPF